MTRPATEIERALDLLCTSAATREAVVKSALRDLVHAVAKFTSNPDPWKRGMIADLGGSDLILAMAKAATVL